MYSAELYDIDAKRHRHEAKIRTGAYLYRLATLNHCSSDDVLSGRASLNAREKGRFNVEQQQVSYCANNILITFAEVLFHMYVTVLKRLSEKQPAAAIFDAVGSTRRLAVFRVQSISDLVFIDSEGAQVDYDSRIRGATVVHPEATYRLFWDLNEKVRGAKKKGVVYPSARHSQDYCFALFDDETSRLQLDSFQTIPVSVRLVAEGQDFSLPVRECNPFAEKLHSTMGYYEFGELDRFEKAKADKILNPHDIPSRGLIDFVRRKYREYPKEATICPSAESPRSFHQTGAV
jgi:RES domain-containing protein